MADQIVALTNAPQQSFTISLQVDGNSLILQLSLNFSEMCGYWLLSVASSAGTPLIANVPMICGDYPTGNILAQYGYLQIGSAYVLNISGATMENPGPSDWGTNFNLLWSDTAL